MFVVRVIWLHLVLDICMFVSFFMFLSVVVWVAIVILCFFLSSTSYRFTILLDDPITFLRLVALLG